MMKAMQVGAAKEFERVEREVPKPGPGEVRIRVKACGICHSDAYVKGGLWPGMRLPRIPGHEVAGIVDEAGPGVEAWKKGRRVGVGWAGGRCGACVPCRRGDFVNCAQHRITGIHYDGGYAEYMVAPQEALAAVPEELSFEDAAPLLCAGITTFNALRNSGAGPGDLVAVQGIGGLGHLGIQFARKMGFQTVAVSAGKDKEELAMKLGAHAYVDGGKGDAAQQLQKLGGAKVILATAPSGKSITPLVDGLGHRGELVVVGASADPIEVTTRQLIGLARSIRGWPSGSAVDAEDAMRFCVLAGIRPMIEKFPLENAPEAYERMMANRVRFRAVLSC